MGGAGSYGRAWIERSGREVWGNGGEGRARRAGVWARSFEGEPRRKSRSRKGGAGPSFRQASMQSNSEQRGVQQHNWNWNVTGSQLLSCEGFVDKFEVPDEEEQQDEDWRAGWWSSVALRARRSENGFVGRHPSLRWRRPRPPPPLQRQRPEVKWGEVMSPVVGPWADWLSSL